MRLSRLLATVRGALAWRPSVSRAIAVPAPIAWRVLTDVALWPHWGPSVTAVQPPTLVMRAGARGRVRTRLGLWAPFLITSVVVGEQWRWRVYGVPATGHRVIATGAGHCRVWFDAPLWQAPYLVICVIALRRIDGVAQELALADQRGERPVSPAPRPSAR